MDEVVGQWITLAGASTLNCEELDRGVCAVPALRHLEAAAGAPTGTNPRRSRHCARRRHGRNLRCTCVVRRWMVQSVLAVPLWPFARIPNPDRRFQTFPRLRPSRAANSASAAKAWLDAERPTARFGELSAPVVIGSDSLCDRARAGRRLARRTDARQGRRHGLDVRHRYPDRRRDAPVSNPAVDKLGNIYTTFSGSAGQKTAVSIYKIDTEPCRQAAGDRPDERHRPGARRRGRALLLQPP